MTLWMLRRLLKFCLKKYIGPYIQGELDLEQLDFQLSAAVHLNDISLNVDAINAKINEYPFALKEGSLERVTLKLSPQLNVEVDGVELHFIPQTPTNVDQSSEEPSKSTCEAQQTDSDADHKRTVGMEGFTYMPVQEGVRVVADLFERLFLGVHIVLSRVFIALEEMPTLNVPKNRGSTSHCMLLCRIGCAQYQASRLEGIGGGRQGEKSSNFTGDISFQQVCLELVDVRSDGSEDPNSMAGNSKVYGQPMSLMQDDAGLSGNVKLSICTKPGSLDMPKVDAEVNLEHIRLHFTAQQIEQVMRVISSYRARATCNMSTSRGVDPNDQIVLSRNEIAFARKTADMRDCREASFVKSAMLGSHMSSPKCSLLPGAKVISDWVHWNVQEEDIKEAVMSEEELAASTEEFFDCLSGSGLWMLTSSAFGAVSAASNSVSGPVLHSPVATEPSRQVTDVIKVKLAGFSVMLMEGHSRDNYIEAIIADIDLSLQVCQRRLTWQLLLRHIEAFEVRHQKQDPNILHELDRDILLEAVCTSAQPLQALVEQSVPKFPVCLSERSQTGGDGAVVRKCFLRLSDQGHLPALQVDAEHKFSCIVGDERDLRKQDLTAINFHFQPLVLWVDTSIIRMLLNWHFGSASEGKRALPFDKGFSAPCTRQMHVNMSFSHVRLWVCSPYSSASTRLLKDHLLCLDLSCPVDRPMVKLKLSDSVGDQVCLGSATLAFKESCLYLVSSSAHTEGFEKGSALGFHATKVLGISLCSPEMATVEIYLKSNSGGEISLAERAWLGVAEQQKGGMGGRKTSSEFAAATATEVTDKNNHKIREEILHFSSARVLVAVPKVKVELQASQLTFVVEILMSLVEAFTTSQTVNGRCTADQKDNNQVSLSLEVGEAELSLYPDFELIGSSSLEMKRNSPWEKYIININKLQMLNVVKLGTVKDASYFWLHHENGFVKGLLADVSRDEILLFSCRDDALGRGDGAGGNALATKFAGIEVSVISWPGGVHAEDTLITVSLGGCTFMAHGGRLDWLLGVIAFFSRHADESLISYAIHEKDCFSATETSIVRLEARTMGGKGEISSTNNSVLFSLDLHDAALCYEPGKEAVSAAILRAKNSSEQFDPVACLVAAAAIRVSSYVISNSTGKNYEIWLRDVALLLADTSLRRSSAFDYTPESLHRAGYVKVAGEAVMKAVVHIDGEDGLEWEVECANNQLRLDTCHDTTAALGRLIAQLQQLFIPEEEHPSTERDVDTCCCDECSGHGLSNGATEKGSSDFSFVNSKNAARFEGFLEDACLLVRGCSVHSCCNCLDLVATVEDTFEMLSKSVHVSDDVAQESFCNLSDQWFGDGSEKEDLRTPVLQSDEASSFIEDYYVSKVSSLQSSSRSSSYRENGASMQNSRALSDDLDIQSAVDGSGGWYDGHSFKVVENHVPELDNKPGLKKHRDNLHSSKMRLGRLPKYPQSVGRVIFQDLNLRWRLYGGSDWPVSKRKDPESSSARQNGVCLEVIFQGVDLQHDSFPRMGVHASRLALSIRDVGIYDCSKGAAWKKVLGYHQCKSRPRESSAKTLKVELESVRPDPLVPVEEYRLFVQLLPLLLHLDQRHIDFLTKFFTAPPSSSKQPSLFYEEISSSYSSLDSKVAEAPEDALLPFFQICEVQPFSIKVDYVPRHVDIGALKSGNYAELANLFSWKGIELELKYVRVTGVHGWGTFSSTVAGEWLEDIAQNQIHKLLKGLGPIRPLYAVGSGAAKLVVLPAEQYRRDRRRLLRGIRKGATAFLRSISLEAVGLGVQLAAGAHEILLQTESALGSVGLISSLEKVEVRAKVGQPGDMREGLQQAYESLSQGLERTATSLIGNPMKAYHKAGTSTAVAGALRAAPAAAVAPAVAAAGALHRALLGMRNGLDPERRRESEEKHSDPPPE